MSVAVAGYDEPPPDWDRREPPADDGVDGRLPPQDLAAEMAAVGAMMITKDALLDVLDVLPNGAVFYRPAHESIYDAAAALNAKGEPTDPITVGAELTRRGELAKVGGASYLVTCTEMVPIASNARLYAQTVRDKAVLRGLVDAGTRIVQMGYAGEGDVDQITARAAVELEQAVKAKPVSKARSLAAILPSTLDIAQHGHADVLGTGWPDLDRHLGGLAPGRLVVFGARPSVGKSLVCTNLALHFAAHHQHAVLFCSLEMPETEVMQRMLAAYARVDLGGLQKGGTSESDWEKISAHYDSLAGLPIVVDDAPEQTVAHIRRRAMDVQRDRDDLAVIVVDYLQLVAPADTRVGRVEQLGAISRGLKLLARETGACVVAAAQVNRGPAARVDKRPTMSDLRESGSIEADADQVVLLHQPDEDIAEVEFYTDKNRHGTKGPATMQLRGHYARFESAHWRPGQDR